MRLLLPRNFEECTRVFFSVARWPILSREMGERGRAVSGGQSILVSRSGGTLWIVAGQRGGKMIVKRVSSKDE